MALVKKTNKCLWRNTPKNKDEIWMNKKFNSEAWINRTGIYYGIE